MTVLDQFRDAEQRVAQRLKELEPAVAEYRDLEAVAQRLGIDRVTAASAPATRRTTARRRTSAPGKAPAPRAATTSAPKTPTAGGSRRSASAGQRGRQVLELVRERPGITVREAGTELGVDPTSLYRVVRRLEQGGELRKNGRRLEPTPPTTR